MSMADLLAKQDIKSIALSRGQEIEGEVISILSQEVILDLGTKAEGVLQKKDLTPDQLANLKVGDKLLTYVLFTENESGQVVLGLQRAIHRNANISSRWKKFEDAKLKGESLIGKGIEVNKGGLIVEIGGVRGFLPSSQVTLSQAANLDELVGKDISVTVIEADPTQNRLIFSQKANVSDETKKELSKLHVNDKVNGTVASVLPFGIFVTLENGLEGLVHISEISWDKVEDPSKLYKVGDVVESQIVSVETSSGRVNLSIKQLSQDPFGEIADRFQIDDIVKGTVIKVASTGITVTLEVPQGDVVTEQPEQLQTVEGIIPSTKLESDKQYEVGQTITCMIDSIDVSKRRINLVPFITSTKDLIYK